MNTDYEIDNEDKSIYQQAMDENASLRVQLAEKDKEIIKLKDANEALQDCLNGSSKAVYTAEMYDELKRQLAEKDKQILWLQEKLETAIALGDEMRNALKKAEAENAELKQRLENVYRECLVCPDIKGLKKENAELRERLKAVEKVYKNWSKLDEPQYPNEAIINFILQREEELWQAIKKAVGK